MNSIAIISDIHGNSVALDAVLADIDKRGIKEVYCLGDLVGYYCYFNEVIETLVSRNIPAILGNHDYALIHNHGVIERSKTCTHILKWQLERIKHANLEYLSQLPNTIELDNSWLSATCVHGGLKDNIDEYLFHVDDAYLSAQNFNKNLLITGHTHLPSYNKFFSGKGWLNPGSVGQPRDGINKASYALIHEDGSVEFVRIGYDYNKVVEAMKQNGFADYISETLITGKKIGL